ncbi:MAG: RNA-binding transcriptional accessory protein [Anaerolineales bacterium]|nr:RNA-binding transcriptional accessory protein [Anaerolineales bacterium]
MSNTKKIAESLHIPLPKVNAVVKLLNDGNTIPFIARYRKETTGGLDEEQLRQIEENLARLRSLQKRRETIVNSIQEQGKLTPKIKENIQSASTRTELEDLYQPYKPKRKTRAGTARKNGLEGLSDLISKQPVINQTLDEAAKPFLSTQVKTLEQAWQGARDIAAEIISDHPETRKVVRKKALSISTLTTEMKEDTDDPKQVYLDYYDFKLQVNRLRPHQTLAINRAEKEGVLKVKLSLPEQIWQKAVSAHFPQNPSSPFSGQLSKAINDAAKRLLLPSIYRDVRRALTEKAEDHAVQIFAKNLHALLLQPPLAGHTVLGLDPGYRTGCKVAVIDPTGKPLQTGVIYPVPPRSQIEKARDFTRELIRKYGITLIVIGNGTGSRETENFTAGLIKEFDDLKYLIINEAGASVYSASKLAGRELPDMDVSLRGAVSIARRVQDPLAEYVKIDPKSLGVGMYQHDLDQAKLKRKLTDVVESVVNQVGVEINTASPALLAHISGIGPGLAERIVSYRDDKGLFSERDELLEVPGMGEKTYQQAAGFLRIREGVNPIDDTAIHPESYPAALAVLDLAGIQVEEKPKIRQAALVELSRDKSAKDLAQDLKVGVPTLIDIFNQLAKPGRDPREDLPKPFLRSDVLSMDDLVQGMELQGTVQNVVEFGAFVDLGVKQDGLLHRTKIPAGVDLNLGNIIRVTILSIDKERGRISLGWAGD